MNIVSWGGGTNSTAMIIGMYTHEIPIDLILFADAGGEYPHTYAYIDTMNHWLQDHGLPPITRVYKTTRDGQRLTLEQECLQRGTLPSIVYGRKACSIKYKLEPQAKFCNNYAPCIEVWRRGGKVDRYIGYDAGETRRAYHAGKDKKYTNHYPLLEWGWSRKKCEEVIEAQGLPLPHKSSCFFCPSSKKEEIRALYTDHPDLFDRAVALERGARLTAIRGLGHTFSWADYIDSWLYGLETQTRLF